MKRQPHPLTFFKKLKWLDGRPLLETIEPYRQRIFADVLYTFDDNGRPKYNLALCGRAKKNHKSSDLVFAALYRFLAWHSDAGNDVYVLASDEGQAADDLDLCKKLILANACLSELVTIQAKGIVRNDGKGTLRILPAQDIAGLHGKTYLLAAFDEIHTYKDHAVFEALALDPSRHDALQWITSYSSIRHAPGIPLHDMLLAGKRGDDPRMFFSWYSGSYTTDPSFVDAPTPEARANPSLEVMGQ